MKSHIYTLFISSFLLSSCQNDLTHLNESNTKVVNGEISEQYAFYGTLSQIRTGAVYCGGVFITDRIFLTAAHCAVGFNQDFQIRIGLDQHNPNKYDLLDVETIIANPAFKLNGPGAGDLALIKVKPYNPLVLKNKLEPIEINSDHLIPSENENLLAIGIGKTSPNSTALEPILRKVELTYKPEQECKTLLKNSRSAHLLKYINSNIVCAINEDHRKGICGGDSGSPLLSMYHGKIIPVGMLSMGGCTEKNVPAIYSRISTNLNWINETKLLLENQP